MADAYGAGASIFKCVHDVEMAWRVIHSIHRLQTPLNNKFLLGLARFFWGDYSGYAGPDQTYQPTQLPSLWFRSLSIPAKPGWSTRRPLHPPPDPWKSSPGCSSPSCPWTKRRTALSSFCCCRLIFAPCSGPGAGQRHHRELRLLWAGTSTPSVAKMIAALVRDVLISRWPRRSCLFQAAERTRDNAQKTPASGWRSWKP